MNFLGIGFLTNFVNPGSYKFGRKKFSITSSLIYYLYKDENSYKALAIGVDIGQAYNWSRYIPSISDSPFPNTLFSEWNHQYQISYLKVSSGIQWKQKVNSRIFYRLGFSAYQVNMPNVSHYVTIESRLSVRTHIHGMLEFPVSKTISLIPNFVFSNSRDSKLNLFRLSSRFFYKRSDFDKWIQIGLHAKSSNSSLYKDQLLSDFEVGSIIKIRGFIIGFTYDRDINNRANNFEVSLGYFLSKKGIEQRGVSERIN